ncbi:MAG: hypothetical protein LBT01_02725 [Spirochaetaceae bacterium]|jgi:hypothetical protein|nr:hypothetical protein [Spirochaetaceae bacterium]
MFKKLFLFLLLPCIGGAVFAQDGGFGFGFDDTESADGGAASSSPHVTISGKVQAQLLGYTHDMDSASGFDLGNILQGKLNFAANSSVADAFVNLKIEPQLDKGEWKNPFIVDEAYARFYFGDFQLEGGLRKLTWGKADSLGPLDVVNPLNYSDLSKMSDLLAIKIARPMLDLAYSLGSFTKLEAVFVPWFQGNEYAADPNASNARWIPEVMTKFAAGATAMGISDPYSLYKDTERSIAYAQAGLRFTTTLGSSDLGMQYYYGRLPKPAINASKLMVGESPLFYNAYHQVGFDYAQVIAGFNIRAELAANLTDDFSGDDGSVYNPKICWSLGFDRDLFLGINLNLQVNEAVALMHGKIDSNPLFDTEAGTDETFTRLTVIVSKKVLRDELEFKVKTLWTIEQNDCYIIPSIAWTRGDVNAELSGGIFAGDFSGEFGYYHNNSFIKALVGYTL